MKRTYYKTHLFNGSNAAADAAVLCAARQNGESDPMSLESIAAIAKAENAPDTSFSMIDDHTLIIDAKQGGKYVEVCIIEQIEVTALKETVDDLQEVF